MGKQPFISHVVNGYSRYDVPENKAFTCTPGILYPVRIDFINARDRVRIDQGIDVRTNPLAVPSFNPYTVRLHRFWVPLQLYHPEMRTNSSKFDMNNLSLNWQPLEFLSTSRFAYNTFYGSLLYWLRVSQQASQSFSYAGSLTAVDLDLDAAQAAPGSWFNCDSLLAYWDIIRNYYAYSQWGIYSIATANAGAVRWDSQRYSFAGDPDSRLSYYQQFGNLEYLDAFYESQFYPSAVSSSNNTFNRSNLYFQIVRSLLTPSSTRAAQTDGYPVASVTNYSSVVSGKVPKDYFSVQDPVSGSFPNWSLGNVMNYFYPMAVAPSNPDRFSRLLPVGSSSSVSMTGVTTIPQLAIASRLQEYKDLLGSGGSRYSDWLETFFASKIEHVDRPKLLFAASQTVNVQIVMNQSGTNNFGDDPMTGGTGNPLGQQGGAIAFNTRLGRSQSYYFLEPGYLIDILSIRPVYYWSGIRPDYLNYLGADYFNPIYNDIGYQDVPGFRFGYADDLTVAYEPCFNEFRSSYDEVLGQLSSFSGPTLGANIPLYSYWVQQRRLEPFSGASVSYTYWPNLFVDMSQVNSPFASKVEDNFFINMAYSVQKRSLVNKTFATRLSNR